MTLPFRETGSGVRLVVRLTPRGGREAVDGIVRDADGRPALAVRIAAPPVDGEANKALVAFLAKALGLRKSDVEIVGGETSRTKVLNLSGDETAIMGRLAACAGRA